MTAVELPAGVDGHKLTGMLRDRYGVVLAGGQRDLQARSLESGTSGQSVGLISCRSLSAGDGGRLGMNVTPGAAVAAAESFSRRRWSLP